MGVQHKVVLYEGSTQGGYTWGLNTRWLYMEVKHKVVLYEGSTQGGCTWGSTQGGCTWGFNDSEIVNYY